MIPYCALAHAMRDYTHRRAARLRVLCARRFQRTRATERGWLQHASFLRPPRVRLCVFVRCVRSHAAGCSRGHSPFRGITAFAPVSRASASGIRLALPLAVAAIDLANLLRELSFDRVWRWPTSGEWRSAAATGTPGESGERHEERNQRPGASVSDRRDCFSRHPQVMAQATPCIRSKK